MKKREWVGIGLAACCVCGLYLLSSGSLPSGYADSDELITASYFHSVAHPPGFPLFISLNHLFFKLLFFMPPVRIAHLLSAVYQSGALIFLFLLLRDMLKRCHVADVYITALSTTAVAALSYYWWLYGSIFEITSFTNVLGAAVLFCAFRWYNSKTQINRYFWLTWVCSGVLVSHFQLGVLLFPGLLIILFKKTQKIIPILLGLIITTATFFIVNLLLFVQNTNRLPVSWEFPSTLTAWLGHISRRDYTGFNPEINTNFHTAFPIPTLVDQKTMDSITNYARDTIGYYSIFGIIFGCIGCIYLWEKEKILTASVGAMWFFTGPFLAAYMRLSQFVFEPNLINGMGERQFVLNQIPCCIYIGFGISAIIQYIHKRSAHYSQRMIYLLISLMVLGMLYDNQSILHDQRSRQVAYRLALTRLSQVPENALIICTNDVDCYSLLFLSNVQHVRPDVLVLPHVAAYKTAYLMDHPEIYPYADAQLPDYLPQLLSWNMQFRPIFFTSGIDFYPDYIGLENGPFYFIPEGLLFQVTTTPPSQIASATIPSFIYPVSTYDRRDKYGRGIGETISNSYAYAGFLALKYQLIETATTYFQTALTIDPNNNQAEQMLENRIKYAESLKTPFIPRTQDAYIAAAKQAELSKKYNDAERYFRQATYINPTSTSTIATLADFYTRHNLPDLATRYLNHQQEIVRIKMPSKSQ